MIGIASLLPILNLHLPFNTAAFDYMNGVLVGFWILYMMMHRILDLRLIPPFLVLLLGSLLSMFESPNLDLNILTIVQEVYLALFFIVLYNVLESERDAATLVRFWMVFAAIQGVFILGDLANLFSGRAQGTFDNPNMAASYVGISMFLALHPACGFPWPLRAGYILLMAGALFATKSLSGVAGAIIATVVAYTLYWFRAAGGRRARNLAVALVVVLLAGLAFAQVMGVHNFLDRGPKSADSREQIWKAGLNSFLRSPLGMGVGPGGFVEGGYVSGGVWGEGRHISLHSDYLSFLTERGIIGFLGLLALLGSLGLMVWRAVLAHGSRNEFLWRLALWAAFCFIAIDALGHEVLHYRHVWVIFALIALEDRRVGKQAEEGNPSLQPSTLPFTGAAPQPLYRGQA